MSKEDEVLARTDELDILSEINALLLKAESADYLYEAVNMAILTGDPQVIDGTIYGRLVKIEAADVTGRFRSDYEDND